MLNRMAFELRPLLSHSPFGTKVDVCAKESNEILNFRYVDTVFHGNLTCRGGRRVFSTIYAHDIPAVCVQRLNLDVDELLTASHWRTVGFHQTE